MHSLDIFLRQKRIIRGNRQTPTERITQNVRMITEVKSKEAIDCHSAFKKKDASDSIVCPR